MNTTKAIIILVVFITGLILGYQQFVTRAPEESPEITQEVFVPLPKVESVGVGQTVQFGDLQITLNEVVQDSRCPVDAECIEGGAINTNITLSVGDVTEQIFYSSDSVPLVFEGYSLGIVNILPPRNSTETIEPGQYIVDFSLESLYPATEVIPSETPSQKEISPVGYACINAGGQWSPEFSECLGISGTVCGEIGGTWNECASACRNNPDAEVCTMQCVQVCEL